MESERSAGKKASSIDFPSDMGETIKAFQKSLGELENLVKLFKSDLNKPLPFDTPDPPPSTMLGDK